MLTIVVAHHAEGKAFLEYLAMRADKSHGGGRRYIGNGVRLRIVGQGGESVRRSLAEEFLLKAQANDDLWLNFGIAGSAEHAVGDVLEIASVGTAESAASQGLHQLVPRALARTTHCQSFSQPQMRYPRSGVVDMEAFFMAEELASRGKLKNLTIIKLVVDGPFAPLESLTPELLKRHLVRAQPNLTEIVDRLIIPE